MLRRAVLRLAFIGPFAPARNPRLTRAEGTRTESISSLMMYTAWWSVLSRFFSRRTVSRTLQASFVGMPTRSTQGPTKSGTSFHSASARESGTTMGPHEFAGARTRQPLLGRLVGLSTPRGRCMNTQRPGSLSTLMLWRSWPTRLGSISKRSVAPDFWPCSPSTGRGISSPTAPGCVRLLRWAIGPGW